MHDDLVHSRGEGLRAESGRTMANQTLTPMGELRRSSSQSPGQRHSLGYKIAWRWRTFLCWARYALVGRRSGMPGLFDFVFGNRFFNAVQVPSELAALGEILAEHRPERALEIGTFQGGTLLFLTRLANPQATIVSMDLPGGMFGGGYGARRRFFYRRLAGRRQKLHLLQGDSHSAEMFERAKAALGNRSLDYLFIDGDHRYEGVKRDFETYGPLVRAGGLIALHDIVEGPSDAVGGVPQFWRELKHKYRHREIIQCPRQGGFGIGVLYVD